MQPIISTNVRIKHAARRASWAAMYRVAPQAALRKATRLFLETPPRPAPSRAAIGGAVRFTVPFAEEVLAGWSVGEGRQTVLLVHGWGGRGAQMRGFVDPLLERGYRVVAFDAPGHGESTGSHLALPEFAAAIRALASVVGPLHALIAHSFGAAASSVALAQGLEVQRAVLLGAPADELRWFEHFAAQLGVEAGARLALQRAIETHVGAPFSQFLPESLGPSLKLPLLVVHDRDDQEVPWEDGARIAGSAPHATLLTTHGLGHRRILRDPRVIERAVAFLDGELGEQRPVNEGACRQCGGLLNEPWDGGGEWCLRCGLQRELANPALRWAQASS